jgi:aryl-alcohol dehydrogenase-like predicted oxidoreductase
MRKLCKNYSNTEIINNYRKHALTHGVNLIDTSANYELGKAEKLIGKVLHNLISENKLKREAVFVMSKVGYLQGPNLANARKREQEGNAYDEMVNL